MLTNPLPPVRAPGSGVRDLIVWLAGPVGNGFRSAAGPVGILVDADGIDRSDAINVFRGPVGGCPRGKRGVERCAKGVPARELSPPPSLGGVLGLIRPDGLCAMSMPRGGLP
jgi:hypothetical protein